MDLKKLRAALKAARDAMMAASEAVKAAPDDDARTKAQEEFDGAKATFDQAHADLKSAIELAEQDKAASDLMMRADGLTTVDPPTDGDGLGDSVDDSKSHVPGQAKDHGAEDKAERVIFAKFMRKKSLSDREIDRMTPKSDKLRDRVDDAATACKMPTSLWLRACGFDVNDKSLPMLSSDDLAGGGRSYLSWPDYGTELQILPPENPNIFDRVRREMVTGSVYKEPHVDQDSDEYGGVAVSRNTEGSTANETEVDIKQLTVTCYPLDCYTEMSNILLRRDRVGLEAKVLDLFGMAFRRRVNWEVLHGTGDTGSMCLGIRQSDDVNTVARQVASQVSYTDLVNLIYAIRASVRIGASFSIGDSVAKYLQLQKSGDTEDDRPLFAASTRDGIFDRLCGQPWFTGTDASTIGTNGDVVFGQWLQYLLAVEMEAVISRSPHYKFKNGVTAYRLDALVGGKPRQPKAFSVLVGTGGS